MFFLSCVCYAFVRVCFFCALWSPAVKGLTSWLSFVVYNCEFVTFPLVSWVRCGTWLYRFLIFAPLFTFNAFYWYQFFALDSFVAKTQNCVARVESDQVDMLKSI